MSADTHFLAVKTLSKKSTRSSSTEAAILTAMRHNLREIQAELGTSADGKIDPTRIHLNKVIFGPQDANEAANAALTAIREAGVDSYRKNAVVGIEVVASLPARSAIDRPTYFAHAVQWAKRFFDVPMLSAVIHEDEENPHVHIIMLPIQDGKLIGSELLGDRRAMKAMQADFHGEVGKRHGLRAPVPHKRLNAVERRQAINCVREFLQITRGLPDDEIDALLRPHEKNPMPLLAELKLNVTKSQDGKKSFVEMMTRPCGLESPSRKTRNALVGNQPSRKIVEGHGKSDEPYALLGDSSPPSSYTAKPEAPSDGSPAHGKPKAIVSAVAQPQGAANATSAHLAGSHLLRSQPVHSPCADETKNEDGPPSEQKVNQGDGYVREREDERLAADWDFELGRHAPVPRVRASRRAQAASEVVSKLANRIHRTG